ncbi:MAG: DUF4349 domain-containing protein [Methylobacillus sp.]|jgi:hypothetical protein|nr:DUF4349 domain-containing protein [Methylobacillus sp.]
MKRRLIALAMLGWLLAGCSPSNGDRTHVNEAPPPPMPAANVGAQTAPTGALLAYEHTVTVTLGARNILPRLQELQSVCAAQKFGTCAVLDSNQSGGDDPQADLTVRIAPQGVEPMIAQAGQGGEIRNRYTHAEDLSAQVRDNQQTVQRLQKEQAQLQEFQLRRDLAVADMIALSKEMASVQTQLEEAEKIGEKQQQRLDTQLLRIRLSVPDSARSHSEIGNAFGDFFSLLSQGTAWTIRAIAFLIPAALVLWAIIKVRRWRRRRVK